MSTITINNKEYTLADLSPEAQQQFANVQALVSAVETKPATVKKPKATKAKG